MITIKVVLLRKVDVSFSFQRSQSRYSISRGLKSRNIWYSSTWKHLHCHLFSFLLLSCWMWITQWPPHISDGCVYWYKTVLQKRCTCWLFWKLNTWSLQSSLEFACHSHASLCWYLPLVWKTLANHFSWALHDSPKLLIRPGRHW